MKMCAFGWYSLLFLKIDKLRETHSYLSYWTCRQPAWDALRKTECLCVFSLSTKEFENRNSASLEHRFRLCHLYVTAAAAHFNSFEAKLLQIHKNDNKTYFKANAHTCVPKNQPANSSEKIALQRKHINQRQWWWCMHYVMHEKSDGKYNNQLSQHSILFWEHFLFEKPNLEQHMTL